MDMKESSFYCARALLDLLGAGADAGDRGTGIDRIVTFGKNLLGSKLPPSLVKYAVDMQNALFGDYPNHNDVAPSIFFAAFFGFLMIIHTIIFAMNCYRGHYFWLSLAWMFYCVMKVAAFGLRAHWAYDVTRVKTGLASSVLQIVPAYYLVSFNLILTQRLFTWRHPVGGSRWLFWNFMFAMYALVFVFIAIIIMASLIPYQHYLRHHVYYQYAQVVQGTAVIIVLYVLTSVMLIILSYAFPPTTKDENLYTYQPWWIESFSPFYFVEKGAAQRAEATFMKRNHNHRHAIRVIAATHHHYKMVKGLSNERGSLKHNISILIISVSTILILVEALLRCVVVFQFQPRIYGGKIARSIMGYVTWGIFEGIVMIIYIVGRVDLRFYRPDILPQEVRAIITAKQSYYPSESEDEFHPPSIADEETAKSIDADSSLSFNKQDPPYPTDEFDYGRQSEDTLSFRFPNEKEDNYQTKRKAPLADDDESVFHF